MPIRLFTPVFALTLLISAALLFSVQPMFSKMILPLLGGTPQVWNTAMLFFQLMLLGGYAYAHGTTKLLGVRSQAVLHVVLLSIFLVVLPMAIPEGSAPPTDRDPTLWQLSLMFMTVGGPFFVLAGSAPMLQRWFSSTSHPDANNPYFLYGASNLGSMAALLAYPVIAEPLMTLDMQSYSWAVGYGVLIVFTILSVILVWGQQSKAKTAEAKEKAKSGNEVITWKQRFKWLLLAFIPSSMMLGVTTYITTDVATVPMLWIIPLALYVGTFIIVFARKEIITANAAANIFYIFLCAVMLQTIALNVITSNPAPIIFLHFGMFFFAAILCHKELADSRPSSSHLTEFYLLMSVGGALGGFFNAIIAPQFFVIAVEYALVIALACFIRMHTLPSQSFAAFKKSLKDIMISRTAKKSDEYELYSLLAIFLFGTVAFLSGDKIFILLSSFVIVVSFANLISNRWAAALAAIFLMMLFPPGYSWRQGGIELIQQQRNFFGVARIMNNVSSNERLLLHGTTNHGTQSLDEEYRLTPLSYYTSQSPIADGFTYLDKKSGDQAVAVVGLGVGVTSCFQKDGRTFDFFEIDKDIAEIAENKEFFTFLSDCGSPYEIILGDGRLTMQKQPSEKYDVILVDAFSSDSIPIHLMTKEATEIFLDKLKPDGILMFHITNRHIDLEPVLSMIAQDLGVHGYARAKNGGEVVGTDIEFYPAHVFAMTRSDAALEYLKSIEWDEGQFRKGVKIWTDQYSNLLSVFGNVIGVGRFMKDAEETRAAELLAEEEAKENGTDSDSEE